MSVCAQREHAAHKIQTTIQLLQYKCYLALRLGTLCIMQMVLNAKDSTFLSVCSH